MPLTVFKIVLNWFKNWLIRPLSEWRVLYRQPFLNITHLFMNTLIWVRVPSCFMQRNIMYMTSPNRDTLTREQGWRDFILPGYVWSLVLDKPLDGASKKFQLWLIYLIGVVAYCWLKSYPNNGLKLEWFL